MRAQLTTRWVAAGLIALLALVILSGCGGTPTPPPTPEAVSTSLQLSWVFDYSSAGFYAAELNGHFAKEGLDVTLSEGGFVGGKYVEPIDEVIAGDHDFGMASDSALLQARAQGKPVVALATVLQRSPAAIISLPDSNITRPQDLIGKTVAVSDGGARQTYDALLKSQGIDPAQINTVSRTEFGIEPLLNGDVDALYGWIINEGVLVREAGQEPNIILISDYGIDSYDFLVFATEKTVKERPELVEHLMRAMLAGLQDVVDNPEQAAEYILRYNSELKKDEQLARLQAMIPLIHPARSQIGMMQQANWNSVAQILIDNGTLDSSANVSEIYTLDFLNKIYAAQS